jgi:hypothetical protein
MAKVDVMSSGIRREAATLPNTQEQSMVRSHSVVARVVAGETLIVPVRGRVGDLASIYRLNGTGSLIWEMLESPRTVKELATAVSLEYDVDPAQAANDVASFVADMNAMGLLERFQYAELGVAEAQQNLAEAGT